MGEKSTFDQFLRSFAEMANVDIVVALESSCPHSIRDAAEAEGGVTIVNDNWLKSSLIHGKLQDWDKAEYMPSFD